MISWWRRLIVFDKKKAFNGALILTNFVYLNYANGEIYSNKIQKFKIHELNFRENYYFLINCGLINY